MLALASAALALAILTATISRALRGLPRNHAGRLGQEAPGEASRPQLEEANTAEEALDTDPVGTGNLSGASGAVRKGKSYQVEAPNDPAFKGDERTILG